VMESSCGGCARATSTICLLAALRVPSALPVCVVGVQELRACFEAYIQTHNAT
jgi:hypothetical protein